MSQYEYEQVADAVSPTLSMMAHPELHHYTTFAGLSGILSTNSLWASSYLSLNDATEFRHLGQYLATAIQPALNSRLRRLRKGNIDLDISLAQRGGPTTVSNQMANFLASEALKLVRSPNTVAHEPFVVSLCSHRHDHPYEQQNGLLSQWRAYGVSDGAAIVFDAQKLWDWAMYDASEYYYQYVLLKEVIYNEGIARFREQFVPVISNFERYAVSAIDHEAIGAPILGWDDFHTDLFLNAARFKHEAFKEEREVRLILSSVTQERVNEAGFSGSKCKVVQERPNGRGRFIAVESHPDSSLRSTIRRIIVGPTKDQETLRGRIQEIAGPSMTVVRSATPLIR